MARRQVAVVSSCGTSLLTNPADPDLKNLLNRTANESERTLSLEERNRIDRHAEAIGVRLCNADLSTARRMSAEINGLMAFYGGGLPREASQHLHFLLHTDTYQGQAAARLVESWCRSNGMVQTQAVKLDGLTTRNSDDFHWGMNHLVLWCENDLLPLREVGYYVVFNLVGGFKAMQGHLNTLGMFYADEIVYIFESSDEPIRIPRLPVVLDDRGMVGEHLPLFRRLSIGEGVSPVSTLT